MILPYIVSDLSGILHNPRINLKLGDIKNMMLQLLESINYIHCQKFMHRDIKTANILIDHNGVLKLADFGLARIYYGAPPNSRYPGGAGSGAKYTSVVVTRWYRAPELVLGDKTYTTAVDIWGAGCVFAEFFEKKPILQGSSDIDQGHVIFKLLGTPSEADWPLARYLPGAELTRTKYPGTLKERFGSFLNDTGLDFLQQLLALDPYKRLTAMSAVHHPFFKEEPLPSTKLELPCEESHESDIKRYKEEMQQAMSQKAPSAPQGHVTESLNVPRAPKGNLPKAPARNLFPKGPAAMPGLTLQRETQLFHHLSIELRLDILRMVVIPTVNPGFQVPMGPMVTEQEKQAVVTVMKRLPEIPMWQLDYQPDLKKLQGTTADRWKRQAQTLIYVPG